MSDSITVALAAITSPHFSHSWPVGQSANLV
jgi:hypothetical protein